MERRTKVALSFALAVGACHPSALAGPRIPDLSLNDLRKDPSLYPKYHELCLEVNNSDMTQLESHRCIALDLYERQIVDEKLFGSGR